MNMPYPFPNMPMAQPPFSVFNKLPMAPPLYIGDLDENIHDENLHDFFSKFGPLHFVRIMRDPASGKSRGFAYVNFIYPRDAESARQYAQYEKLGRKYIRIMFKRNVRDLPPEANVFVKNLDPSVTVKDLHNHFSQVTGLNVLCAKVATDAEGHSLGYGYVQFEKKEDAENALEQLQGSKLKEEDLQLSAFVPKDKRAIATTKRNIYVKHLPTNKSKEELEALVDEIFQPHGEIETKFLQKHPTFHKYSAFICFKDEEGAQKAYNALTQNPRQIDGSDEPLYVNWHQGRNERTRELKRSHQQTTNETNLYVKNLKAEVTETDLKRAFQQFGLITSTACREWNASSTQKQAKFGFVAFDNADDARRAQAQAHEVPEIRALFLVDAQPYIGMHQSKDKRKEYLYTQRKWKQQQQQVQGMPGMDFRGMPMQIPPNRRFQPFPPMMNPQQFKPPVNRGQPKPGRGGANWGKGPQPRGGAPRQMPQGPRQPPMNQQHHQLPKKIDNNKVGKPPGQAASQTALQNQPITVQTLRPKLNEFLALDVEKQRQILGELLFPLIKAVSGDSFAPKITGMLIDLSVLEVTEILEFLENPDLLQERVQEAMELIQSEGL